MAMPKIMKIRTTNLLLNYISVILIDNTDVDESPDQKPVELENSHLLESSQGRSD
jgi:hypothetical protein